MRVSQVARYPISVSSVTCRHQHTDSTVRTPDACARIRDAVGLSRIRQLGQRSRGFPPTAGTRDMWDSAVYRRSVLVASPRVSLPRSGLVPMIEYPGGRGAGEVSRNENRVTHIFDPQPKCNERAESLG